MPKVKYVADGERGGARRGPRGTAGRVRESPAYYCIMGLACVSLQYSIGIGYRYAVARKLILGVMSKVGMCNLLP